MRLGMTLMSTAIMGSAALGQSGDIFTWTGEGNDNLWTTSQNWRDASGNHGVPGFGDRAVIDGVRHPTRRKSTQSARSVARCIRPAPF